VASSESGDTTHVFLIPGATQDIEMIWDLFSNTVTASAILNEDADFRHLLEGKKKELLPPGTGRYSQLKEWESDIDNPAGHHRHISHLYAVVPGHQIHPLIDQKMANAAKKSLDMRGAGRYMADDPASGGNWSMAYRMWCWARLLEGDRADMVFDQHDWSEGSVKGLRARGGYTVDLR
jgi:alpha-L-fucosidase 2